MPTLKKLKINHHVQHSYNNNKHYTMTEQFAPHHLITLDSPKLKLEPVHVLFGTTKSVYIMTEEVLYVELVDGSFMFAEKKIQGKTIEFKREKLENIARKSTQFLGMYQGDVCTLTVVPVFYDDMNEEITKKLDASGVSDGEVRLKLEQLSNKLEEIKVMALYLNSEKIFGNLNVVVSDKIPKPELFPVKLFNETKSETHNMYYLMNHFSTDGLAVIKEKTKVLQKFERPKGTSHGMALKIMKRQMTGITKQKRESEIKYYLKDELEHVFKIINGYACYLELCIMNVSSDCRVLDVKEIGYHDIIPNLMIDVTLVMRKKLSENNEAFSHVFAVKDDDDSRNYYVLAKSKAGSKWNLLYGKEKMLVVRKQ